MKARKKVVRAKTSELPKTISAARKAGFKKIRWKALLKKQRGKKPPHPDAADYVDGVGPNGIIRCWYDPATGEYDICYPLHD
jgi:hypothetical protein